MRLSIGSGRRSSRPAISSSRTRTLMDEIFSPGKRRRLDLAAPQAEAEAHAAERLQHAALGRAVLVHGDRHRMEEPAAVLGVAVALGADAAEVRAQAGAA